MHFPIAILRRALIQTALHLEREKSVARTSQENALKAGGDIISRLPRKLDGKHCAKKDLWLKSRATACADNGLTINRPTSPEELPRCLKNKMSRGPEKCLNTALLSDSCSNFPRMQRLLYPRLWSNVQTGHEPCGQGFPDVSGTTRCGSSIMQGTKAGISMFLVSKSSSLLRVTARKRIDQRSRIWFPKLLYCTDQFSPKPSASSARGTQRK